MRPVELGYRRTGDPGMTFHSHPFYEVFYFHSGRCNYVIGPNVYTLQPGDLILMHGLTLHTPNPDLREPYVRSMIHFHPEFLHEFMNRKYTAPLLRPFEELRNYRLQVGERRAEVEALLADMGALYASPEEHAYERFLLRFVELLYVINDLCRKPMDRAETARTDRERHVQRVIEYIEAHYAEDVTMEALERELHVSRHYLARMFKAWTGWTVFQFLYQRRINQAKTLFLLENDLSVSEVSECVGFKHLSHFSRVFKQWEGCAPERFRRRLARAEGRG
ncbi:AraC family transcriptional regulator [Paenibacillus sp.]|uniref:AraC family transcriptional regulator n=1 Tax=Paenibacillus sp. TaxID=58172 RepID=UPI002D65BC27|nr:AraC family transcriptional regulator [Paenibacillus sp.]HZG56762.1 AraC family transcriptional regulator [Paenibacillus sp.]